MSAVLAITLALLALNSPFVQAAPVESGVKPEVCVSKIVESGLLSEITIPKEVSDFVTELRGRELPQLRSFNLIKFADSDLISELPDASDSLIESCTDYAKEVILKTQTICDLGQYAETNAYPEYVEEAGKHPEFVNKVGHAKACLLL